MDFVSSPSFPMSADTHSSTEDSIPDVVVNSDSDVRKVRRSLQNEDGPYKRLSTSLKIDTSSDQSSGSNGGEGRGFTQSENDIESHKIHQNYLFGFKKWKSHVTTRPLSSRSEIVQSLYADVSEVKKITVSTCGFWNILYAVLFGWWVAAVYCLVGGIMYITMVGKDYAFFCFRMADYFLWPFGKFVYLAKDDSQVTSSKVNSSASQESETSPLVKHSTDSNTSQVNGCEGFWGRSGSYVWLILGLPLIVLSHVVVMCVTWLLVISIGTAKVHWRTIRQILYLPPTEVKTGDSFVMDLDTRRRKKKGEILMYTHNAVNLYYYKYTVDGMNIIFVNLLFFVILSLILGYTDHENEHYSGVTKVILGILAIVPLTYYIGMAIICISAQSSYAVGAVLNATCGTVVEMILSVVVLNKGNNSGSACYVELVKSNLAGTIIGSILLIPGLCMIVGGVKFHSQRFNHASAGISSLLLFVAVSGVFAPTLFARMFGDLECQKCENFAINSTNNASIIDAYYLHCTRCRTDLSGLDGDMSLYNLHIKPLVYASAILLPIAYIVGMIFSLKTHAAQINADYMRSLEEANHEGHQHSVPMWSRIKSLTILLCSATLIAFCAELVSDNIKSFFKSSGISEYFIGILVIAMVTELPEIINGVQFSLENNVNLGIEIGTNTAIQVCMIQVPILVLIDLIYPFNLVMVFNDVHLYAVIFSVVVINYTFQDGKSDYFQGAALFIIYIVILCMYYFMPIPDEVKCT
uniref:Low affinity vacuolar monovalent cation/H(+) antiporter-like isoform X1 n=2 Tax=Crassostrea virginica TaxID=6565 RepID=A0A8B8D3P7_CRAVI|nr:low affinity vacuolar monovalent cation/H(+) antiporter-like isoform X1 [Crassostrea virginica]